MPTVDAIASVPTTSDLVVCCTSAGAPKGEGLYTSVDVSCPRAHIKKA